MSLPPGQRSAHPSPEWGASSQASPDFPGQQRNPTMATGLPPTQPPAAGALCCQHSQGQESVRGHEVGSLRSRHERQSARPRPQAQGKGDAGAHVTRRQRPGLSWEGHVETQAQAATSTPREDQATARPSRSPGTARLPHTEAHTRFPARPGKSLQTLAVGPNPDPSVSAHVSPTRRPQAFQLPPSWAATAPLTAEPKQRPREPFIEKVGRALMRTGAPRGSDWSPL